MSVFHRQTAAPQDVLVAFITGLQSEVGVGANTVWAPRIFEADATEFCAVGSP